MGKGDCDDHDKR